MSCSYSSFAAYAVQEDLDALKRRVEKIEQTQQQILELVKAMAEEMSAVRKEVTPSKIDKPLALSKSRARSAKT